MRIIKGELDQNTISTLVGEMLNIENSLLHFIDGKPTTFGSDGGPRDDSEYRGYPRLIDGTTMYEIRAASGYIYVPVGTNVEEFETHLIQYIMLMERDVVRLDGRVYQGLSDYHTVSSSYATNIKIKSAKNITASSKVEDRRRGKNNTKRQFITDPDDLRRGRFTWHIRTVDKYDDSIVADQLDDATSRIAASIFWDREDICKLPHNSITMTFSVKDLKGWDLVVDETVILFEHATNPLLFELNAYWRANCQKNAKVFMRNIDSSKVYAAGWAGIEFKPVKLNDSGLDATTDICSRCRQPLYDENYALYGPIANPEQQLYVALCPLCMHTGSAERPVEAKYRRTFRVKFPRTIQDVIEMSGGSDELKQIRLSAANGYQRSVIGGKEFILIGDKYVAFQNIHDFLYSSLSSEQVFAGRKVCNALVIS